MSEDLVNGTMSTIYNLNWDDQVTDVFNTILAIMIMQVDSYTGSSNVEINGVYMVPIVPISH